MAIMNPFIHQHEASVDYSDYMDTFLISLVVQVT